MAEITLTDANFEAEVLKSDLPILVDFWAIWCSPCKMQNPILEEVEKELAGRAKIGKVNVDENPNTASKYAIMSIPTLMLFHKGQVVKQFIGVQGKETLLAEFQKVMS